MLACNHPILAHPILAHPILANDHAIGIGLDFDGAADGARGDRVRVGIKTNQAGLGDSSRHRVVAVEPPR